MGVRVRLRIRRGKREIESSALVNTGFEAEDPEILLPAKLAEELGLYPPGTGAIIQEYDVVGGVAILVKCSERIHVEVEAEDRRVAFIEAVPVVSAGESEA